MYQELQYSFIRLPTLKSIISTTLSYGTNITFSWQNGEGAFEIVQTLLTINSIQMWMLYTK